MLFQHNIEYPGWKSCDYIGSKWVVYCEVVLKDRREK